MLLSSFINLVCLFCFCLQLSLAADDAVLISVPLNFQLNFRDLKEIKESEQRAHSQAEVLKNALDEHSLELRVKAANEAEAACQLRLSTAEAEIADLRAKLDSSERCVDCDLKVQF